MCNFDRSCPRLLPSCGFCDYCVWDPNHIFCPLFNNFHLFHLWQGNVMKSWKQGCGKKVTENRLHSVIYMCVSVCLQRYYRACNLFGRFHRWKYSLTAILFRQFMLKWHVVYLPLCFLCIASGSLDGLLFWYMGHRFYLYLLWNILRGVI